MEHELLVVIVGLCTALERGRMDIVGAERLLFSPWTMDLLRERGFGDSLVSLIHEGTEFEGVSRLCSPTSWPPLSASSRKQRLRSSPRYRGEMRSLAPGRTDLNR